MTINKTHHWWEKSKKSEKLHATNEKLRDVQN